MLSYSHFKLWCIPPVTSITGLKKVTEWWPGCSERPNLERSVLLSRHRLSGGNDPPINGGGKMSADLFTRSWNVTVSWNHERGKFKTSQWKYYTMQQVMNLWNGLSPRGGTGWQHKWIPERLGQTREWQSHKGELREAKIYSVWLGFQGGSAGPYTVHMWGLCGQQFWPWWSLDLSQLAFQCYLPNSTVSVAFASWRQQNLVLLTLAKYFLQILSIIFSLVRIQLNYSHSKKVFPLLP